MKQAYRRVWCSMAMGMALTAAAQQQSIVWHFDEGSGAVVHDSSHNIDDPIHGYFLRVPGVSGNALSFDGYTTSIERAAKDVPDVGQAFTVSAWIALDDYPWNSGSDR